MRTLEVSAAVIVRGGKLLATQRGYGEQAGGWEFPGGKVEPGETPGQAVVREVREELGVDVAIDRLLAVIDYDHDAFRLHMHCFVVRIERGEIELREHSDARWLGADELDSVAWLPADLELVDRIRCNRLLVTRD